MEQVDHPYGWKSKSVNIDGDGVHAFFGIKLRFFKILNVDMQDIKIAAINLLTFTVSFSNVEQWLKIALLVVSIAYTVLKIFKLKNPNEADK